MALWTITSPKKTRPQEEVESQEVKEKRGWLRITLAITLLALVTYSILQVLGVLSPTPANAPTEAGAAPPVVQVTAPPVVEPEPVPVVVETTTTTTEPAPTTTTIPETTTTTTTTLPPVEMCVDSFLWKGGRAEMGVLLGPEKDRAMIDTTVVSLSVCLLDVYQKDLSLLGETLPVWFIQVMSGEGIVADIFLGPEGGPEEWIIERPNTKGYSVPFDPTAPDSARHVTGSFVPVRDIVEELVVGRLYPIRLTVSELQPMPERCPEFWQCLVAYGEFSETPKYHDQLYRATLGTAGWEPEQGFGEVGSFYMVPVCPETICPRD